MWVCAGQDGLIVHEEGAVVGGECEVEDESAGIMRCDLVALIPFPTLRISIASRGKKRPKTRY